MAMENTATVTGGAALPADLVTPLLGRRHSLAERAAIGRADAQLGIHIYLLTQSDAAAVAYRRELGRAGWANRSARRRGLLGRDTEFGVNLPTVDGVLYGTRRAA